jgi:hypothetical protein
MCSHLNSQVLKLGSSNKKGVFLRKISSEIVAEYPDIDLPVSKMNCEFTKGSWEEGVDITFKDEEETTYLYVQVKWSIDTVDDLDIILSKFHNYYQKNHQDEAKDDQSQLSIDFLENKSIFSVDTEEKQRVEFMIIT